MNLISIRIITANIGVLIEFYEKIMNTSAIQYTADFAEIQTKTATLAIGSINTLKFFGDENIAPENRSAIIEFLVDDVDKEFERQRDFLTSYIVQEPTLMPWGNKSLLLRDPDGNLINLFTPYTQQAKEKFQKI